MSTTRPHRILFVCMGNICRSPIAECVFRHKIKQRGVEHLFEVDSAGTGGWHAGEPPDDRACRIMTAKGVPVVGRARQITRADFTRFDLLLCMDDDNRERILTTGAPTDKVRLLLECDPTAGCHEVPDPYYGGADGFEHVFRLIDSACEALLEELLRKSRVEKR